MGVGTTGGTSRVVPLPFEWASARARAKALLNRCWAVGKPVPGVGVNLDDDGGWDVVRSNTEPINGRSWVGIRVDGGLGHDSRLG